MKVLFVDQVVAVQRGVELREFLQRPDASLDQEGQHGQLGAAGLFVFLVDLEAEGFQIGDVGILVIGDRRDHYPVACQVGAGDLLDPRQRLGFHRTELGEIHARPGQQIQDATASHAARRGRRRGRTRHHPLDEGLHVLLENSSLGTGPLGQTGQIDT